MKSFFEKNFQKKDFFLFSTEKIISFEKNSTFADNLNKEKYEFTPETSSRSSVFF